MIDLDKERIGGLLINYYFICKKKLWYYCNQLSMESGNENVQIGKILDETSYENKDKHIDINGIINIDFIKNGTEIHEIKKSKSIEEAGIWQTKYYMYYLKQHNVKINKAIIDYPFLHESKEISLTIEDENRLEDIINDIIQIKSTEHPPNIKKSKICKKCAYYDMCMI